MLRRWVPTCTTRWCLRAAASMAWPSTTSTLIGFCDVDVGPGLDGGDHRQGVPVVGRGDQDDVEVLLLEHLAVVGVGARLLLRGLAGGDHVGGLGQHLLVDVAERDDLDGRDLDEPEQVALAVPAAADQADALCLWCGECRRRGRSPAAERANPPKSPGLEEFATIHDLAPQFSGRWWAVVKLPHKIAPRSSHVNLVEGRALPDTTTLASSHSNVPDPSAVALSFERAVPSPLRRRRLPLPSSPRWSCAITRP